MLQLKNNTPFEAALLPLYDSKGVDTLYIMVSATFNIGKQWVLADKQEPPRAEDEYWGDDPQFSSIKWASDYHIGKPATDVVMVGSAHAPEGRSVSCLDVNLRAGLVKKTVRVFGERQWHNGHISPPQPFETMPLIYERAFGGIRQAEGMVVDGDPRNLVGCGYPAKERGRGLEGQLVPNLEDPRQLLQRAGDIVSPAGFGFISPNWQPRLAYAGTYDERWSRNRAPFLPEDFDHRFLNSAHPDLIYPGYMTGGEPVEITGIHPAGTVKFKLPTVGISANVLFNGEHKILPFNLETVLIKAEEMQLVLGWRASLTCDKAALKVTEVGISLSHRPPKLDG